MKIYNPEKRGIDHQLQSFFITVDLLKFCNRPSVIIKINTWEKKKRKNKKRRRKERKKDNKKLEED